MSIVDGMKLTIGSPIVKIYDINGTPLTYKVGIYAFNDFNVGRDVIDFNYEYNDDGDDECNIKIETTDPELADHPNLQENSQIKVQWGYIEQLSPTRSIAVRTSKTRYLEDKIVIELKCTDLVSFNRTLKNKDNPDELSDRNKSVTQSQSFWDFVNRIVLGRSTTGFKVEYNGSTIVGGKLVPKPVDVKIVKKVGEELNDITSIFNLGKVSNANKNTLQSLKEVADKTDNGPWYFDGRDGELTMHNRTNSFVDTPKRSYKYRGESGDLLSFIPEIKDKIESISLARTTTVDPDSKEVTHIDNNVVRPDSTGTTQVYARTDVTFGGGIMNELYHQGGIEAVEKYRTQKYIEELWEEYAKYGELALTGKSLEEVRVQINTEYPFSYRISETQEGTLVMTPTTEIDNTATKLEGKEYVSINMNGAYAKEVMQQMLVNEIRQNEQTSKSATLRVIGDPLLENRWIIEISGVAKKHSGKYYIMKANHMINSSGYYVELDTYQETKEIINILSVINNNMATNKEVDEESGEPTLTWAELQKKYNDNSAEVQNLNLDPLQARDQAIIFQTKARIKQKFDTFIKRLEGLYIKDNKDDIFPTSHLNSDQKEIIKGLKDQFEKAQTHKDLERLEKEANTALYEQANELDINPVQVADSELDLSIVDSNGDVLPNPEDIKQANPTTKNLLGPVQLDKKPLFDPNNLYTPTKNNGIFPNAHQY